MKMISVVMATFNGAKYLEEQIESILTQSRVPDEIVVVDDRSEDETFTILRDYQARFPHRIRVFQNSERLGVNKNFEKAASLSTGDLIFFSDQDDVWKDNKIEVMLENLGNTSLLYSSAVIVNARREIIHGDELGFIGVPPVEGRPCLYLVEGNSISGHNILVTRELIDKAIPFYEGFVYDKWLGLVACLLNGIRFLDKKLVEHRMHESNAENNPELREQKKSEAGNKNRLLGKRSKLERYRDRYQDRLGILKHLQSIEVESFPHKRLLQLYTAHLENSKWCFFNWRLYRELLKDNYGSWNNLPKKKQRKMIERMSRGELWYRVCIF